MSVNNGQDVSAEITNAAFMSRTVNTDTVGLVGLLKPTGSGSLILDLQKTINNIITALGMADQDSVNLDFTGTTYLTDATAKDALEQLDTALLGIFSSNNTWGGENSFSGLLNLASENNSQDGSSVTITGTTKTIVRLTNASLFSVGGITATASNRIMVLQNKSGFEVTVLNEDLGSTAADRITTGTDNDIALENGASLILIYDTVASRWSVIGGTGGGTGILVVADITARNAIASGDRYDGLIVYVISEQKNYQLIGGTTNSDWKELGFLTTATDAATGSNQTLSAPTTSIIKTSPTLTSIAGISAASALKEIVLVNTTGATLIIRHESGSASAANRIYTGTGSDLYLKADSAIYIYYDNVTTRWRVIGAPANNNPYVSSFLTLVGGNEIGLTSGSTVQSFLVSGNSAAITLSTTPFGSTAPINGTVVKLIGNDDTKTVTIPVNDASKGVIGYSVTLGKGQTATYEHNTTLDRWVIISTSN